MKAENTSCTTAVSSAVPIVTWKALVFNRFRKVDVRLPLKGNSNYHGARPVYSNPLEMIKWIRTSRLSIKNCLSSTSYGSNRLWKDLRENLVLYRGTLLIRDRHPPKDHQSAKDGLLVLFPSPGPYRGTSLMRQRPP